MKEDLRYIPENQIDTSILPQANKDKWSSPVNFDQPIRILQLCKKFPYPRKDGESIAVDNISRALHELGCSLTLLSMNTSKHYVDTQEQFINMPQYDSIHVVHIDNRVKYLDAFFNLFSDDSYHITRFISKEFKNKLTEILEKQSFDIIQIESIFLAPYIQHIRSLTDARICMRAHNVEHEIWERIAMNTKSPLKKWYLEHLSEKLKRFEKEQLEQYDLLIPITERDLNTYQDLGYQDQSIVSPVGIDIRDYLASDLHRTPIATISFLGSLDWIPNQEGITWFLDEVWGEMKLRFPHLQLHIAGRNMDNFNPRKQYEGVQFCGEIQNAMEFLNAHPIMVAPLFSGSGMRVKILEAMALGRVVICTSMACEGIAAKPNEEVLIADTKEDFLRHVENLLVHPELAQSIGTKAQVFVAKEYDNKAIATKLLNEYKSLVRPKQQKQIRDQFLRAAV